MKKLIPSKECKLAATQHKKGTSEMYNITDAKKVIASKKGKDLITRLKLYTHKDSVETFKADTFKLPYRIIFDYLEFKNYEDFEHIIPPISEYYPLPSKRKEKATEINLDYTPYNTSEWCKFISEYSKEYKEQLEHLSDPDDNNKYKHDYSPHVIKWHSPDGKTAEYYFTRLLIPYKDDISNADSFFLFGDTRHSNNDVTKQINDYMARIEDYNKHPNHYDNSDHYKKVTDYVNYYVCKHYMWDGKNIPDADNKQDIINILEHEYYLEYSSLVHQKSCKQTLTRDIVAEQMQDSNSVLNRLNSLILKARNTTGEKQ